MALISLGKITVVTAGTPVKFTSSVTNANSIFIQYPFGSNTGPQIYIGAAGLVKATLVGVWRVLVKQAAATSPFDTWNIVSRAPGPFDLSTWFLDADASGDFALVSYLAL